MILLGNPVLNLKSVVATRSRGWNVGFESTTVAKLTDNPLTDDELIEALIARERLEPIVLDRTERPVQDYQLAYKPVIAGLENFYSFSREIFYEGDSILWTQLSGNSSIAPTPTSSTQSPIGRHWIRLLCGMGVAKDCHSLWVRLP